MDKNKRILLTGAAGFIGSNLTRHLFKTEPGIKITCIDNFDPFYSADIKQLNISNFKTNPNFHFLDDDLARVSSKELCELIDEPVDVIVHIAAKAGVRPSILNPLAYQQTNVIGTQQLLDFAKEKKVKQFVFASSSSVYGINDHYPWKEDEQLMPISPYAMTKLAGEMLGHVYSRLYDIRFIALRFFGQVTEPGTCTAVPMVVWRSRSGESSVTYRFPRTMTVTGRQMWRWTDRGSGTFSAVPTIP